MPPDELARLYDAHAAALFGYLSGLLNDDTDVRDVLQSIFHKLAARPGLLAGVCDQRSYLLRLAHHAAVDWCRHRARERLREHQSATERAATESASLFPAATDPDEAAFRQELHEALTQLPADQRAVVLLRLWEGFTFERIAATLEIPLHTAASRFRYGIDKLRNQLRPFYDEIR
jgi:RNA polymerase sigma-70 factor (ECF subfamily)